MSSKKKMNFSDRTLSSKFYNMKKYQINLSSQDSFERTKSSPSKESSVESARKIANLMSSAKK